MEKEQVDLIKPIKMQHKRRVYHLIEATPEELSGVIDCCTLCHLRWECNNSKDAVLKKRLLRCTNPSLDRGTWRLVKRLPRSTIIPFNKSQGGRQE